MIEYFTINNIYKLIQYILLPLFILSNIFVGVIIVINYELWCVVPMISLGIGCGGYYYLKIRNIQLEKEVNEYYKLAIKLYDQNQAYVEWFKRKKLNDQNGTQQLSSEDEDQIVIFH